ncbi:hypothetical protein [Pelagibacterium montanilacus]|uniref:hypothetical protein n=1 Tax=Pelagibacterium montanilacus TaxID=2185280 RepID=UPI000F8CCE92|nr:hypothetical protein [Pelagibacterium montanilacus]
MRRLSALCFGLALTLAPLPVLASGGTSADLLRDALYAGTSANAQPELAESAVAGDGQAAFGTGLLTFVSTIEGLAQALNRHGFDPGRAAARVPVFMGVPAEPGAEPLADPEPLDYAQLRAYLEAFGDGMDAASEQLLAASADTDFVVEIDIGHIRLDLDGDGQGSEAEALGAMLFGAAMTGAMAGGPDAPLDILAPGSDLTFAFDGSDAIWLAGYAQVLAVQAEFLLSHDFSDFFDTAWHLLFPDAGLPMQDHTAANPLFFGTDSDTLLADSIAAIHTLDWPVADRERLAGVAERLGSILDLSRRHWDATLAETDDRLEFIPGPHQTPVHQQMAVTTEMVEAWRATLDTLDNILSGELLLPHWRFADQGFDLARYFATAERTDLVLILTGYGALPFLGEGPIASAEDFAAANAVFGRSIWGYALWFN